MGNIIVPRMRLLANSSSISGILPIIFFFIFFRRNKELVLWVVFLYTLLSFSTDIAFFIAKSKVAHFRILYSFTIIEYTFFSIFLYLNLKSSIIKRFLLLGSLFFYFFALYSIAKTTDYKFDSLSASVESTLIILYSILFFFEQLKSPENTFIYSSKNFWITVAILVYLAATLFLFISSAYISDEERKAYWPINHVANIIKNILISFAFILKTKGKQPSSMRKTYNI